MLTVIRAFYLIALLLYGASSAVYLRSFSRRHPRPRGRGASLAVYGALFQFLALLTYSIYLRQLPFLGMYQGFNFAAFVMVVFFLFYSRSLESDTALGVVVFPLVTLFSLAGLFTPLETVTDPLLQASLWFVVHASVALFSYAAFAMAFVTAVLYLMLHKEIKSKRLGRLFERLPSLGELDHLTYLSVTIGFIGLTVAIATGMAWSQARLGKLLQMDPKEIITFVNWLIFALYLHTRFYGGWKGRRAAWMAVAGFLVLIFNFLVVTLFMSSTHGYL